MFLSELFRNSEMEVTPLTLCYGLMMTSVSKGQGQNTEIARPINLDFQNLLT
jgi:hypothetical protein